jgi:hypothetical protein
MLTVFYSSFLLKSIAGAKRSSKGIGLRTYTQPYFFAIRSERHKSYGNKPVE